MSQRICRHGDKAENMRLAEEKRKKRMANKVGPFEMSGDSSVPCEEFNRDGGPGKRCQQNNGTCPVNGDSTKCGRHD